MTGGENQKVPPLDEELLAIDGGWSSRLFSLWDVSIVRFPVLVEIALIGLTQWVIEGKNGAEGTERWLCS